MRLLEKRTKKTALQGGIFRDQRLHVMLLNVLFAEMLAKATTGAKFMYLLDNKFFKEPCVLILSFLLVMKQFQINFGIEGAVPYASWRQTFFSRKGFYYCINLQLV